MIIPAKVNQNWSSVYGAVTEEMSFKGFSIFSPGGHLVQRSGTIWAILVEGNPTVPADDRPDLKSWVPEPYRKIT